MNLTELLNAVNARKIEIDIGLAKLTDETALEAVELFDRWAAGVDYAADVRVRHEDKLYRCVQGHTSQIGWEPDKTPALWADVALSGEIPVWKQPSGAQDAYAKGDKVWYPDKDTTIYESLIDANIWSPEAYPQGWEQI